MTTERKTFYVVMTAEGEIRDFCERVACSERSANDLADYLNFELADHDYIVVEHDFTLDELQQCHQEIDKCINCDWHNDMWEEE